MGRGCHQDEVPSTLVERYGEDGRMVHPLLTVDQLDEALRAAGPPTLLDVRWSLGGPPGAQEYATGHLPGAAYLDLDSALAGAPGRGGRHPLPEPTVLQGALRDAGVRAGSAVVVYDGGGMAAAARAWWVLRWAGVEDVRVLDGGYARWTAAGLPVTEEAPAVARGDVVVRPGSMPVLDAAAAAQVATGGVLLDARAPERYLGEKEPVDPVAGRIPGAVNAPANHDLSPDGGLVSADALRSTYAATGALGGGPVAAYCGSGVTAAQTVLALASLGVRAGLYVGSWSEWITDPSRPVERG
jgi:thiosulfate/3-mercaptopyruvate sulfurtransferase